MAIPDPYEQVYAEIVRRLYAEPTLFDVSATDKSKIWPGQFTHFAPADLNPYPGQPANAKGRDFPRLIVEEDQEDDQGILGTTRTFGQCDWLQKITVTYVILIVGPDARLPLVSALRWAAKVALMKGPKPEVLGLPGLVQRWSWQSRTAVTSNLPFGDKEVTGGSARRVCKITVPVTFQFHGSSIAN